MDTWYVELTQHFLNFFLANQFYTALCEEMCQRLLTTYRYHKLHGFWTIMIVG